MRDLNLYCMCPGLAEPRLPSSRVCLALGVEVVKVPKTNPS